MVFKDSEAIAPSNEKLRVDAEKTEKKPGKWMTGKIHRTEWKNLSAP